MITAVVFDFDGVIADSEPLHLRADQDVFAAERIALSVDDYYRKYLGFDDVGVFRAVMADQGRHLDERQLEDLIARKGEAYGSLVNSTDVIFPHAAECVRRLAGTVPLAIASGAFRREIEQILTAAGLRPYFRVIVGADDTVRGKPAPDPYVEALRRLQPWLPAEGGLEDRAFAVAIEDSVWGLESAIAAGLRTVAVTTTYHADVLACADRVVADLSQISLEVLSELQP
jgi:beta-phosphoglucomutase-like phosphatase (HAD superfamily)